MGLFYHPHPPAEAAHDGPPPEELRRDALPTGAPEAPPPPTRLEHHQPRPHFTAGNLWRHMVGEWPGLTQPFADMTHWLVKLPKGAQRDFLGKVEESITRNLHALIQEIRETGELAQLLTKSTRTSLTPEEWQKVRTQLLDVAKSVPSLAIFSLPGGMVLLPILLKMLPFDLRPSSFQFAEPPKAEVDPSILPVELRYRSEGPLPPRMGPGGL